MYVRVLWQGLGKGVGVNAGHCSFSFVFLSVVQGSMYIKRILKTAGQRLFISVRENVHYLLSVVSKL